MSKQNMAKNAHQKKLTCSLPKAPSVFLCAAITALMVSSVQAATTKLIRRQWATNLGKVNSAEVELIDVHKLQDCTQKQKERHMRLIEKWKKKKKPEKKQEI